MTVKWTYAGFVVICAFLVCTINNVPCLAEQVAMTATGEQYLSLVALESLEAEYHSANNVVRVKGRFKNISKTVLRGFLTLHILAKNGNVLHTVEMSANDHRPFGAGETVTFDTILNVANLSGASQVSVDFTRN